MSLDKKTLLEISLNPGLNLTIFRVTGSPEYQLEESGLPLTIGIQNPSSNDKRNEIIKKITKKFQWERLESSTWNPESTAWNPESKTVMDSLARGETKGQKIQYIFTGSITSSARVSRVMSHAFTFFFWTKPSWLWFFIFNLLDNHGASNPGYLAI